MYRLQWLLFNIVNIISFCKHFYEKVELMLLNIYTYCSCVVRSADRYRIYITGFTVSVHSASIFNNPMQPLAVIMLLSAIHEILPTLHMQRN